MNIFFHQSNQKKKWTPQDDIPNVHARIDHQYLKKSRHLIYVMLYLWQIYLVVANVVEQNPMENRITYSSPK